MKITITLLVFVLSVTGSIAQPSPIMVCNPAGTTCTPYTNLDTAVTYAPSGSYIYLPGGDFPINIVFDKELHIIGAGHYPDSTLISGRTQINGNIELIAGCDNSSFEGFYLSGDFAPIDMMSIGGATVNGITINRCNIGSAGSNNFFNSYFLQSVVRGIINTGSGNNNVVSNCVVGGLSDVNNAIIKNCVFFEGTSSFGGLCGHISSFDRVSNSTFEENVFYGVMGTTYAGNGFCMYASSNNTFVNNITLSGAYNHGPSVEIGTISNVPAANVFLNVSTAGFDYAKDFHTLSPYTSLGIYGGAIPYKEGAVPSNPHIYFKSIDGVTNTNGELQVQIKVRAEY